MADLRTASSSDPAVDGVTHHPPGFRLRRGRNWFFVGLNYAAYYFGRYNLSMAKTTLCQTYGFNNTQYGLIESSRSLSYAFGQFFNGLLADKIGGRLAMAIGGYGTGLLNFLFGLAAYERIIGPFFGTLGWFILIRGIDGYIQAFGSPGWVKMNTAWFARPERGRFSGIFGLMINLGRYINTFVSACLLSGFTIWHYHSPKLSWQWVFFVPAGFVVVITTLMLLLARNTPEEAGYPNAVRHEDGMGDDQQPLPLALVFRTIMSNKFAWLAAWAYFCTGAVRYGIEFWLPSYYQEFRHLSLTGQAFQITAQAIPTVATLGSILSGYVSDLAFQGRRAPVAAFLFFAETCVILIGAQAGSVTGVSVALIAVAFTCNSTHSILGTAAAMDIGGRKMSGFAAGFIDSWQYIGATVAGVGFGRLIDTFGWGVWLYAMAGFGVLGGCLMLVMTGLERRAKGVLQSDWIRPQQTDR